MDNSNKSLAFVLTSYGTGGIERVMINYANALCHVYNVSIISFNNSGNLKGEIDKSICLIDLGNRKLRGGIFVLKKTLHRNHFDTIITGGDSLNCLVVLATLFMRNRPQIIISQHGYPSIELNGLGFWGKIDKICIRFIYPLADKIIAVSRGIEQYLEDEIKLPSCKISVVYNGININKIIQDSNGIHKFPIPSKYFIYLGRMSAVKNIKLIINAFDMADIEESHLLLLGDGEQLEELKEYALHLSNSNKIHFLGSVSNPFPYLKKSSALLLASYSEACPMVVIEALALGVPIVTTPSKGAKELLFGHKGVFFTESFDNIEEYAYFLKRALIHKENFLLNNEELYSIDESINQMIELIETKF